MRTRAMSGLLAVVMVAGLGVSCTMPPPGVALLAVAYINADGVDGYDPDVDVLIAQFEDVDDSGDPSVGDVIRTDRYPLDQNDLAAGGAFQTTEHIITSLDSLATGISDELLRVRAATDTGPNQEYGWSSTIGSTNNTDLEGYYETDLDDQFARAASFTDRVTSLDQMRVRLGSPSQPDTASAPNALQGLGDDPFIDVDIFYTPPTP